MFNSRRIPVALAGVVIGLGTPAAFGTIITGGVTFGAGSFIQLAPGFADSTPDNTVGNDNFQNQNLYGLDEGQNIVLPNPLSVDDLADGLGGGVGAGVIAAGTVVASHYIFFDPPSSASQQGFVEFDSDILGILSSTGTMAASDFLINTGVNYLNPTLRGLESGDSVTITALRRIDVDWSAGSPGDYVRVLTAFSPTAAPSPTTLALLGAGLAVFGWQRWRADKAPKAALD